MNLLLTLIFIIPAFAIFYAILTIIKKPSVVFNIISGRFEVEEKKLSIVFIGSWVTLAVLFQLTARG